MDTSLKPCHSRAGGNPVNRESTREVGQHQCFVRCAGSWFLLDSRLRGNDGLAGELR